VFSGFFNHTEKFLFDACWVPVDELKGVRRVRVDVDFGNTIMRFWNTVLMSSRTLWKKVWDFVAVEKVFGDIWRAI
jgi:hypothetical protein